MKKIPGPFFLSIAALLWATDSLVRYPALNNFSPVFIVFFEHILCSVCLFFWIYFKQRSALFSLNLKEWLSALWCGIGGSAFATLFFTASFRYVNPSVSVLLQKLQPILVVMIACLFLKEKITKRFVVLGAFALSAGIVLSFPDLNFNFLSQGLSLHMQGIFYAFGAAFFWASSTIFGKILLRRTPATIATFWRFFFGTLPLSVIFYFTPSSHLNLWKASPLLISYLLYMSLIPGLLAMICYYTGLSSTAASVSTFIELLYPIAAVILNTLFLKTPLANNQIIAGSILIFTVTLIALEKRRKQ